MKHFRNSMRLKLLAAAILMVTGTANAASSYQGPITWDGSEFASFAKGNLTGPFDLYWDFSLTGNSTATSSVTSYINGIKDVDFTRVYLTDGTNIFNYTQTGFDPSEQWSLGAVSLSLAGNPWQIHTIGSATNRAGFSGEFQVTAVPEPETYAMFLAGLGLMGFIARRRSKQS